MNNDALESAIAFSVEHESTWDRQVTSNWGVHVHDPAPWNQLLGPVHDRGPVSGVIMVKGQVVRTWGAPDRADLTFSIAKTYLALLAGIAFDQGLITDIHAPIGQQLPGIGFDDAHNAQVTWAQMLQQTSEWTGTLFGLPDQADHYRAVTFAAPPAGTKGTLRPLHKPGTYWEYNDVRINQLSLALLHLFQRPLPEVFRECITRPVGASEDWQWVGYDNAWVEIAGRKMQSVPGGTHWGGGISISANDQVLIAHMLLNKGCNAKGQRVLSEAWIRLMQQPCALAPYYGFLVWLNHERKMFPSVPASSYFGIGAGSSFMWIEPEKEITAIVRWLDSAHADALFGQLFEAL